MDDNFASNHLPVHVSRYSGFNLKSDIHITFMIQFSEFLYTLKRVITNVWNFHIYIT